MLSKSPTPWPLYPCKVCGVNPAERITGLCYECIARNDEINMRRSNILTAAALTTANFFALWSLTTFHIAMLVTFYVLLTVIVTSEILKANR